jgi:hypothetical protein
MWASVIKLASGISIKDYLIAAAAVAAIVFYNVHVHNLEVRYAATRVAAVNAAVKNASDKLIAEAKVREDKMAADYTANLKQVNENYAQHTQTSDAAYAADLRRLRDLAASAGHGSGDGTLESPTGSGASSDTGRSSLIGLGRVSAELAGALRDARDDLGKCYAERESVAGK